MPQTIHLLRHAQGYHNLSIANHQIRDPLLTTHGISQCAHVAATFPHHSSVSLLVASPLRRTLCTALLSFPSQTASGMKVLALPEAQETNDVPCDTGLDPKDLQGEFAGKPVDLSLVREGWNTKTGKWAPEREALKNRAREVRRWLKARPEKEIVLVTHGGFCHYLTEEWGDYDLVKGTGWVNCEWRSYTFKDEEGDNAGIVETQASWERRWGTEIPLTETEELQLKRTVNYGKGKVDGAYSFISKGKDDREWVGAF